MRHGQHWTGLALLAGVVLAACATPAPRPSAAATATAGAIGTRLLAEMNGLVSLDDGCLRVGDRVLVWPPEFTVVVEGSQATISDGYTGDTADWRLGDAVWLGGGEISRSRIDTTAGQRWIGSCEGANAYWLVGGINVPVPATPSPVPTTLPTSAPVTPTPAATGPETMHRPLDWQVVSDPAIQASAHFDFDGQSLLYWGVPTGDDPPSVAIVIQSEGSLREVTRHDQGPVGQHWSVLEAELDDGHAAWLEVPFGDDPRLFRLWAYDLAQGAARMVAESQPFPKPHVPALALDNNLAVVRAVAPGGTTCFWVYDLAAGTGHEPICSPSPDLLYWDPYLRGSLLTYTVQDKTQGCRYIQQTALDTGETRSYADLSCGLGLVAASDEALLFWPEVLPSAGGGEVDQIRLRALEANGQTHELGTAAPLGWWEVCDGHAFWLATDVVEDGSQTDQIRTWAPGEPIQVLYRAPAEHILGPVCDGDQVAFVNQRTGQVLAAGVAEALDAPPSLLYLDDGTLVQQSADGETQALAAVPGLGEVKDALHVGELVLVLETGGLQLVPLGESAQPGFVAFDDPILFGQLVKLNEAEVLIAGHVESGCAATALGTWIARFNLPDRHLTTVYAGQTVQVAGLAADGQSLYLVPVGCDPEFADVWRVSLATGETEAVLSIADPKRGEYGFADARVAPGGRYLDVLTRAASPDGTIENRFALVDLAGGAPGPSDIRRYRYPEQPSHAAGHLWSPDGRSLYFLLRAGHDTNDPEAASLGLWRFDVASEQFQRVAAIADSTMHLVSGSSDGQWLLLRPEVESSVTWVHPATGQTVRVELPGPVQLVRIGLD